MINNKQLNNNGRQLNDHLKAAFLAPRKESNGININVAGVGRDVSYAYEQLRNAAEYTQEHLLTQNAIRRFYVRNLSFFHNRINSESVAEELLIELIQSGYIENDTQPVSLIKEISDVITRHYSNYWRLKESGIKPSLAEDWILDFLSVESEKLIDGDKIQNIIAQFAYQHYQSILKKDIFVTTDYEGANFEAAIYIAVYKSLFKLDLASVRYDMGRLYNVPDENIDDYSKFNGNIDSLFSSELVERLTQYINKYGAPLRVFKKMVEENRNIDTVLQSSDRFHSAYAVQIDREYREARSKLNKGLVKSVIFLIITKSLIGVAIEVPYDVAVMGEILYLPLFINLFSPIVYMILLRFGLKTPSDANTKAMQLYAESMLYGDPSQTDMFPSPKKHVYPTSFKFAFGLMSLLIFGLVTNLLIMLEFNIVQGIIFFVFFATANFLGFRLSRIVRELELITTKNGLLASLRDFIYMPFILLGQWISEKYSKINIVAMILDTIIELPLKTVLRLIRQWTDFINEKRDEI